MHILIFTWKMAHQLYKLSLKNTQRKSFKKFYWNHVIIEYPTKIHALDEGVSTNWVAIFHEIESDITLISTPPEPVKNFKLNLLMFRFRQN